MMLIRNQDRVRLITRGGYDWAKRFPLIVKAALKLRPRHFVIDGEVSFSTRTAYSTLTPWPRASTTTTS
jgi:ATP-dependent DNA ligase